MLMGKEELNNALNLYEIRKKHSNKALKIIFIMIAFLFLLDTITYAMEAFRFNEIPLAFKFKTYTQYGMFFTMFLILGNTIMYKAENVNFDMMPQTNKSRFLAYLMQCYISIFKVLVYTTLLYLIDFIIFSTIANFNSNIHLVYDFNILFFISGFLVNLIYGALGASFIILLGALYRKAGMLLRILFIGILVVFAFTPLLLGTTLLVNLIFFFTLEKSLVLFIFKAVIAILSFTALAWIVNSHTCYYEEEPTSLPRWTAIFIAVFLVIGVFSTAAITSFTSVSNEKTATSQAIPEAYYELPGWHKQEIPLSDIKTNTLHVTSNFSKDEDNLSIILRDPSDELNEAKDSLIIYYRLPDQKLDETSIYEYTNQTLEAKVQSNKLYLTYDYDENQKLIMLTPFGFMTEFERFKGHNYQNPVFGESRGYIYGNVEVLCPEGLKIAHE